MSRATYDNDLLLACYQVHGRLVKALGTLLASGGAVGCVWFLCTAYRAGAL